MKRHILAQGDLDGACFVYSLINAYVSLTARKPGNQGWDKRFYDRWDRATAFIPHLTDFFRCGFENKYSGTGRYKDDPRIFAYTTERVLDKISTEAESGQFKTIVHQDATTPKDLDDLIHSTSVALVCPESEHWVVCVQCDSAPYTVWVACSWRYHLFEDYQETFHQQKQVYSNGRLAQKCEFPFAIQVVFESA
jgi:hypothetical protein